jgi:CDP-glucose 4,6-dehydratase
MEGAGLTGSFWKNRPVLITGATGFLGSWLTRRLLQSGADIVCLVREPVPESKTMQPGLLELVSVVRGDVKDHACIMRALREYEIDTVFHLGAQAIVSIANSNPVLTFESNIQGTWSLLEACRNSPLVKQIIMASSDKAYGDHDILPYHEDMALQGRHPYDVSKTCADLIARSYAVSFGLPVAITRCGNFYGGGDLNWNRIVPGTIRSVLSGQRPVLRSDGSFVRDYFYVEDGAAASMLLAEKLAQFPELRGEAFNFSNEIQITVLELVRKILDLMGESTLEPEVRNDAHNEIRNQYLSAAKARKKLAWKPLFELEEGLGKTIHWYKEYFNGKQG